jgi:Fe-Mn family superoxide dismutase
MKITLPELPYDFRALEPTLSRESVWCHFHRHQLAALQGVAALIRDTDLGALELEDLLLLSAVTPSKRLLFRYAARYWNHHMFWHSMCPGGGGPPRGPIADLIFKCYGTYDHFVKRFVGEATRHYGSGWLWLVSCDRGLRIMTTPNSNSPLLLGMPVILALDLWEHAYDIDYDSRRSDYVQAFLDDLVNWDFANINLSASNRSVEAKATAKPS